MLTHRKSYTPESCVFGIRYGRLCIFGMGSGINKISLESPKVATVMRDEPPLFPILTTLVSTLFPFLGANSNSRSEFRANSHARLDISAMDV